MASKKKISPKTNRKKAAKKGWITRRKNRDIASQKAQIKAKIPRAEKQRKKKFIEDMSEKDIRDYLSKIKMNGADAKESSWLRHVPEAEDILETLRSFPGGTDSDDFKEAAYEIAGVYEVDIREVYTLWYSP